MNKIVKYIIESRFNFNIDLLDLEDNEKNFSLSKQLYKSKSMKEEYLNGYLLVDLGLPSGTIWAKYNLGVDPNDLNGFLKWRGNYYSWGEIEPKQRTGFYSSKYKFYNKFDWKLSKYCTNKKFGNIDNNVTLELEDDVAYQTNSILRIPSPELANELIKYTKKKYVKNYNGIEYLEGFLLTSKINNEQLFFPITGIINAGSIYGVKTTYKIVNIWTSDIESVACDTAKTLNITKDGNGLRSRVYNTMRYYGLPVRPILLF